ncbi:hypothetical protein ACRYCC_12145 [Actinomadura scrupuli]|uniref:hypothetical protein n=1 Tax=Actinomadura scrupuli TaxID=559629 RepID=UPI003D95E94B
MVSRRRRAGADRGAGSVEYVAVLLLIAMISGSIVVSGIGDDIASGTKAAVCRILRAGGLAALCPQQPQVARPQNPCYADIGTHYGELIVTFPVRYVDLRGGIRLGFQKRRIVTPGRPDRWEVTVYGWGEGAIATPSLPGGQSGTDSPAGPSQAGGSSPVGGGAWYGLNVSAGETYAFDNEKDANGFPLKYAEHRARQLANIAAHGNSVTGPLVNVAENLPFGLGGKVKEFIEGDPLPPRKEWSLEAGPTGGFSGKASLFDGRLGFSVGGRGWHLMGIRRNDQGDTTFTMRDSAELEPSAVIDLGVLIPPAARRRFNGKVDDAIDYLERELAKKYGATFRLPYKARESLKANWPDIGLTWKGKISVVYQLTTDEHGDLTRYTRIVDMQGNWYGRAADEVTRKDKTLKGVVNIQVPLGGERTIEQSSLDVTDPASAEAAKNFFLLSAAAWAVSPLGGVVAWGTPAGDTLNTLVDQKGTRTRLSYDSDVGNLKFTGQASGKRGDSLAELKLEGEDDQLARAEIWEDGKGWVPWTDCHS